MHLVSAAIGISPFAVLTNIPHVLQDTLDARAPEQLAAMPRVHMYQSIVDSTVTANEVGMGCWHDCPPPPDARTGFNLGAIEPKGEGGALVVGLGTFARLRSNPFFDVIRSNVVATLALPAATP